MDSHAAAYWSETVFFFSSLMRELPPTATTAILLAMGIFQVFFTSSRHRQRHHGFLYVEAVFGLVVDDRARAVNHLVRHLQVAVGRHAVHVRAAGLCQVHLALVGDPRAVRLDERLALLLAGRRHQRPPRLRVHHVGVLEGL